MQQRSCVELVTLVTKRCLAPMSAEVIRLTDALHCSNALCGSSCGCALCGFVHFQLCVRACVDRERECLVYMHETVTLLCACAGGPVAPIVGQRVILTREVGYKTRVCSVCVCGGTHTERETCLCLVYTHRET